MPLAPKRSATATAHVATAFLEHLAAHVSVPGTAPLSGAARLHEAMLAKFERDASKNVQCSAGEGGAGERLERIFVCVLLRHHHLVAEAEAAAAAALDVARPPTSLVVLWEAARQVRRWVAGCVGAALRRGGGAAADDSSEADLPAAASSTEGVNIHSTGGEEAERVSDGGESVVSDADDARDDLVVEDRHMKFIVAEEARVAAPILERALFLLKGVMPATQCRHGSVSIDDSAVAVMLVPARGGGGGTVDEGEADERPPEMTSPEMTSLLPKRTRSEPPLPVKRMASTGEVMLDILERSRPLLCMRECAALLLKLLQHCCMIKANRTSMFGLAAAQALLRRMPEALAEETLAPVAERIALTIEALLHDELKMTLPPLPPPPEAKDVSASIGAPGALGAPTDAEDAAMEDAEGAMSAPLLSEWSSHLGALLASLHSPTVRAQKPLVKALTQLLPLVTRAGSGRSWHSCWGRCPIRRLELAREPRRAAQLPLGLLVRHQALLGRSGPDARVWLATGASPCRRAPTASPRRQACRGPPTNLATAVSTITDNYGRMLGPHYPHSWSRVMTRQCEDYLMFFNI